MDTNEHVERGIVPILLSVEDAARLLHLGRTTTYQLVLSGRLPSVKVGRRRLVLRRSLEEFVDTLATVDDAG
jgi:excisionase family DNA binding protein